MENERKVRGAFDPRYIHMEDNNNGEGNIGLNTPSGIQYKSTDELRDTIGPKLSINASEAYKKLQRALVLSLPSGGKDGKAGKDSCRVYGVTSSGARDGKSTTAVNLAYTFADMGSRTLLIEADMRRSGLSKSLNKQDVKGLSDYLAGEEKNVSELIIRIKEKDTLYMMFAGSPPPDPSELLNSKRMAEMMDSLRARFDVIILDLPTAGVYVDALIAGKLSDGILMVVRPGHSNKRVLNEAIREINIVGVKLLGFVMNDTGTDGRKGHYKSAYRKRIHTRISIERDEDD